MKRRAEKNRQRHAINVAFVLFITIVISTNAGFFGSVSAETSRLTPLQVRLDGFTSAVVMNDGSLWMWGSNDCGQIGDGSSTNKLLPTKIMNDVKQVSLGGYHSAAIKEDNTLWLWGANGNGAIGNGSSNSKFLTPQQITIGSSGSTEDPTTPTNPSDPDNGGGSVTPTPKPATNTLFGVNLTKVSKGKKSFTAKWKKASKKQQKQFSGYQIQYSTSPDFSGWVKTKGTTKKFASKVVIRKLKKKTTYYVRMRRYKKSGGGTIYSDWSAVKSVKTK